MITHHLKTVNPYFCDIWRDIKTFEIRKNDRGFQVGDFLKLEEYDPITETKSGRSITVKVHYILTNDTYLQSGYVCMAIEEKWRNE